MAEPMKNSDEELDLPVEQDYPASAWDTSTDYGPRKTWDDVREELQRVLDEARVRR